MAYSNTTRRRVKTFERNHEEILDLAYHAALPVLITPELLHLLRINFFVDVANPIPYSAEIDLLLSNICHVVDQGLYEMDFEVREIFLNRLFNQFGNERIEEVANFLFQYTEYLAPWKDLPRLERAQQLTALNFFNPDKARQWLKNAENDENKSAEAGKDWYLAVRNKIVWKDSLATIDETEVKLDLLDRGEVAWQTLVQLTEDKVAEVRVRAVELLGQLGTRETIPILVRLAQDESEMVRMRIAQALGQLGEQEVLSVLLSMAEDSNAEVRAVVSEALSKMDSTQTILPILMALAKDGYWKVRFWAVEALSHFGDDSGVLQTLLERTNDEDREVRARAVKTLSQSIDNPYVFQTLFSHINDVDSEVRVQVIKALGQLKDEPEARHAVLSAAYDEDSKIRAVAVQSLGQFDVWPEELHAVVQSTADETIEVRKSAAIALGRLGVSEGLPALMTLTEDVVSEVRRSAVEALGQIARPEAVPVLISALQDEDATVRRNAARALGQTATSEAVPALLAALQDENSDVRFQVVEALGQVGAPEALSALLALTQDQNSEVRFQAIEALGQIGESAIPTLTNFIRDANEDEGIRKKAVEVLSQIETRVQSVEESEPIRSIDTSIIAILSTQGQIVGTGFLASPSIAVTCTHVIIAAGGSPNTTVSIRFHKTRETRQALVDAKTWRSYEDVAILYLDNEPPAGVNSLHLGKSLASRGLTFQSFGYPRGDIVGLMAKGNIAGLVQDTENRSLLQLSSKNIISGFSGSPVVLETTKQAVGMVSEIFKREIGSSVVFAIPSETILEICPELQPRAKPENPFFVGGRISTPQHFFGRQVLLQEIRDELTKGVSVVITGPSGVGKSSLLYHLYQTRQEWIPDATLIYLDLQKILDANDFCGQVLEKLGEPGNSLKDLRRVLDHRLDNDKKSILFLDEIEQIAMSEITQDNRKLLDMLRAFSHEPGFTLCIAAQTDWVRNFWNAWRFPSSPFLNVFLPKEVGNFSETEAREFLDSKLSGTGVTFNPIEIEQVITVSQRQPAKLQRMAKILFDEHLQINS